MVSSMLTLTIDGKNVTVKAGATILEASQKAGVNIPTLCHDNALHPYGACRICMVEVEGPPRRMLPACTTPAAQGMSIVTSTPALAEARKAVLELLLINHPLDCPVCDKAGECRLQDLVHEYGLGPGAFAEEKRTSPPDLASPVVERDQDRCIYCGKCVRACSELCGVGAITFSMRGGQTRVGAAFNGPLDCEFCGSCIEICPVGALTAKQGKHRARPWNVEQTASTCIFCGCGCPITVETRGGDIVRVRASEKHYLCAKGRFGWDSVRHESRLTSPKVRVGENLVDCTWDEALSVVATNLKVLGKRYGADHIGGLGSVRTTNEDNYAFQKFMRTAVGTNNVDLLARAKYPYGLNTLYFAGELSRLKEHEVILMLESDAGEINPLAGVEIVRAVNGSGSKLIIAGGGKSKFNRIASVVVRLEWEEALTSLINGLRNRRRVLSNAIRQATDLLSSAEQVAIVLPARFSPDSFTLIQEFSDLVKGVTYYPLVKRGNIQGALDMGVLPHCFPGYQTIDPASAASFGNTWHADLPETPGKSAPEMLNGIERGTIAALYIMGDDPVGSDPGSAALLRQLEFLVVQDIFLTDTAKIAHVVLPAASFLEKSGTITTIERRLRQIVRTEGPRAGSRPDWEIIRALAQRMGAPLDYTSSADIMKEIRIAAPMYGDLVPGACWPRERSPLSGVLADLSLSSCPSNTEEVITAGRLLFSSGMMTTRSKELASIALRRSSTPVQIENKKTAPAK
jgi:predicted molibdopterin-dependent oxidoreductase YjgC